MRYPVDRETARCEPDYERDPVGGPGQRPSSRIIFRPHPVRKLTVPGCALIESETAEPTPRRRTDRGRVVAPDLISRCGALGGLGPTVRKATVRACVPESRGGRSSRS